jgi:DNA-binding MarR family transcriptional regulator
MLTRQQRGSRSAADAADTAPAGDDAAAPRWHGVDAAGSRLRYEDFLSFRLGRLNSLIQREVMARYIEPSGLTHPEWRVLARLAGRTSIEMREFTRISLMDKAAISRTVEGLLVKGYVERHVDPAHAKRRIVAITPAGRRLMRRVMPLANREQAAMLRLLSAQERELFGQLIAKLSGLLQDEQAGDEEGA